MGLQQIISEIQNLPIDERLRVIEETAKSIKRNQAVAALSIAAEALAAEYRTNKELTVFTDLEFEDFYEAR